jgi:hypothetical protein
MFDQGAWSTFRECDFEERIKIYIKSGKNITVQGEVGGIDVD